MKRLSVVAAGFLLACSKPASCPSIPPVAERTPQPPQVVIDACAGSTGQCGRAEQIRREIQDVVAAPEFECLVTHFDQSHPFGQLGTEQSIDDCGSPNALPAPSALNGYADSRCVEVAEAMTNESIYRIYRASPADCSGQAVGVIHLNLDISSVPRPFGRTEPSPTGKTLTNDFWFDSAKNYEVAGHWIHEQTHRLGFCDRGAEQYSAIMVPYVYGFAGCVVAARLEETRSKPLSAYRAVCQSQLGPAFRP